MIKTKEVYDTYNIESVSTMTPYINIIVGIFEQARIDWEKGWSKVSKIGEYYNEVSYEADKKYIKRLNKTDPEYIEISKRMKIYLDTFGNKNFSNIESFLNSQWLEIICVACNLDSEAVRDEFYRVKNKILKASKV